MANSPSVIDISSSYIVEPHKPSPEQHLLTGRSSDLILDEAPQAVSEDQQKTPILSPEQSCHTTPSSSTSNANNIAWLLDDDDDSDVAMEVVDGFPLIVYERSRSSSITILSEDNEIEFVEDHSRVTNKSHPPRFVDDSLDQLSHLSYTTDDVSSGLSKSLNCVSTTSSQASRASSSKLMPSPPEPHLASTGHVPEPSFPVRPLRQHVQKRPAMINSSPLAIPPPSQRRIQRLHSSSPNPSPNSSPRSPRKNSKRSDTASDTRKHLYHWMETEAVHSGNESSVGSSGEEEENESDKEFLKDIPDTQVPPSYDQILAYRQSLMSQAPKDAMVPVFSHAPIRNRPFGVNRPPRPKVSVSSSPPQEDEGPDEYAIGSFVVDDDAELSYLNSSSEA